VPTILVADDDAASRALARTLLEHAGFHVREAANAAAALAALSEHPVEVLIADLSMPGVSGSDLVRRARALHEPERLRILLYTGTLPNAAMRDFMETYAVSGIIQKPAEPQTILDAVAAVLAP
jgi:CheY-like chemotaxis protein